MASVLKSDQMAREVVAGLMCSGLYFELALAQRLRLVKRILGRMGPQSTYACRPESQKFTPK